MNHDQIRKVVAQVLDRLPRQFREQLRNVEFVVERRPSAELLRSEGLDPRMDTLYGLYQGVPLPDRSSLDPPLLPDKISIFAEPLLRDFTDPEELRDEIRLTVLHEIAHYFGMDEEEVEDLGYWTMLSTLDEDWVRVFVWHSTQSSALCCSTNPGCLVKTTPSATPDRLFAASPVRQSCRRRRRIAGPAFRH